MVDKSRQMDFKGLSLVADEFVGSVSAVTTAPIATADADDPATTQALVNECKAKINALIAELS